MRSDSLPPLDASPETATASLPALALTPAPRPEVALIPPVLVTAAAAALVVAADLLVAAGGGRAAGLGGALLVVALAIPSAAFATFARARGTRSAFVTGSVLVGVLAALSVIFVPSLTLHPVVLAVAAAAAVAAPHLWRFVQDRWHERPIESVSVLAPTTLAAYEAIQRLAVVPWLRVSSVLVPGADGLRATRLLHRPVAGGVRGGPRLERRIVVSSPSRDAAVGAALAELIARGHDVTSESETMRTAEGRVNVHRADALNLLMSRSRSRTADVASRALDVLLSAVLLTLMAPLFFLLVAIAVVLTDGFPVFYRQTRVGRGGALFRVVKFRSMRRDAEKASGPVWATEGDPRITRVGRFLRRYRIDELPQLWNVLVGEMALVGPRPERPHFNALLRETVPLFELRTVVRPGLTGWAQVRLAYGASSQDAHSKLEYDLLYVTRRSPWFDLAILAETARVVLTGAGSR